MQAISKKISRFQNTQNSWGGETVNEPYILCKISVRSPENFLAYRSHIFRRSLFYKALYKYSASVFVTFLETGAHMLNEGENVNKYPPIEYH